VKQQLQSLLTTALEQLRDQGILPADTPMSVKVERARDPRHGDFASNVAMALAKVARRNPRELAELIVAQIPADQVETEIAGPGFINFRLATAAWHQGIRDALTQGEGFGRSDLGQGRKVQVEFVSANPTGPLHVGHGRGAAYGATVADLLAAVGFEVHREYYVNDAGRQMDILATSIWLRYLELCGEELRFPANGYRGDYVWDIAATLHRGRAEALRYPAEVLFTGVPLDTPTPEEIDDGADPENGGDKETHIDALIGRARELLGEVAYREVFQAGLDTILGDIRDDLGLFGIHYETWFSERSLMESGAVEKAVTALRHAGHLYEKGGAWWFRSTDFGDEKDRVVVRDNGQTTYFASDIAYHMDKLERGFERVIDVWGADHHGYVPRVKAALGALGEPAERLDVLLVQFAILYREGERVPMSTRSGEFVTLRQLRKEVGKDAARFFYVLRRCEQHLDFDLDLAKSQSNDNPVYYVQYAHARIQSVFRQLAESGGQWDRDNGVAHLDRLVEEHEKKLMVALARYPEVVKNAALNEEPHQIAHYLRDLATAVHGYYTVHKFLVDDRELRNARLALIAAARQVLANGLGLLGVSAPDAM
jgi:arginyl-tRNA synthetase